MSLTIPALSRVYPGDKTFALNTPELILSDTGYACVIGKNGSGKSSFGEALAGLGEEHTGQNWYYLPQYLERFLFAENVIDQLRNLLSQEIDKSVLISLLEDLGFSDPEGMLEFPFILMSGGERRRIALVCVFYLKPEFIILDEADIGITAKENMVLLSKIDNLKATGTRVILISHNYEFVRGSSDLICLKDGSIAQVGRTKELLADSKFELKDYGVRFK